MYDFLSLRVKCPNCGESLMDDEHLVDNESSIKLLIEIAGKKGVIRLSSIYGSYNHVSEIEINDNVVARFSCPSCQKEIISDVECLTCGAYMVPFYLDMGGKVSICSRAGCKNHLVEFGDLNIALKKLYQEYGFRERAFPGITTEPIKKVKKPDKKDEFKEIIETGTFLHTYCPHCHRSLIEDEMIKLNIINERDEEGIIMLSPYLNVFTSKSTIFLPELETAKDLKCPYCSESLKLEDKYCDWCMSPVAMIKVSARTKFIDFYVCTKKGCKWHGLSNEDLYDIKMEDSLEW
jgi:ssDNA-binding Zn-finger/Zn-ribbon topoisomerase 1